jgi:hypothetical protein
VFDRNVLVSEEVGIGIFIGILECTLGFVLRNTVGETGRMIVQLIYCELEPP